MKGLVVSMSTWPAIALLCSWVAFAHAAASPAAVPTDPGHELAAFLDPIETLQGRFSQMTQGGDGRPRQLTGVFYVHRPGRFRWEYRRPYEQTIITDGHRLMIYDRDLAQLTIRPLDEAASSTGPAALLSSSRPIESLFVIRRLAATDPGLRWFELVPRAADGEAEFERLRLALDDHGLRRMDVIDRLGNRTEIAFEAIEYDAAIDDDLFDLAPPPGTDVIDETVQ